MLAFNLFNGTDQSIKIEYKEILEYFRHILRENYSSDSNEFHLEFTHYSWISYLVACYLIKNPSKLLDINPMRFTNQIDLICCIKDMIQAKKYLLNNNDPNIFNSFTHYIDEITDSNNLNNLFKVLQKANCYVWIPLATTRDVSNALTIMNFINEGLYLKNYSFINAPYANLSGGILDYVDLTNANLNHANIVNTYIRGISLNEFLSARFLRLPISLLKLSCIYATNDLKDTLIFHSEGIIKRLDLKNVENEIQDIYKPNLVTKPKSIAVSSDANLIAILSNKHTKSKLIIIRCINKKEPQVLNIELNKFYLFNSIFKENQIILIQSNGEINIVPVDSGKIVKLDLPKNLSLFKRKNPILYTSYADFLAISFEDNSILILKIKKIAQRYQIDLVSSFMENCPITAITLTGSKFACATICQNIYIYQIPSMRLLNKLNSDISHIKNLSFNPNETSLLVSGINDQVVIFDVNSKKIINRFFSHQGKIYFGFFAINGNILTAGKDKKINFWNHDKKSLINHQKSHTSAVSQLTIFSHIDEQYLASGGEDGCIIIWKLNGIKQIASIQLHQHSIRAIIYNEHQHMLISIDEEGNLKKWNIPSWTLAVNYKLKQHLIRQAIFDINNQKLVITNEIGNIYLYDMKAINPILLSSSEDSIPLSLSRELDSIIFMKFSRDGGDLFYSMINDQAKNLCSIDFNSLSEREENLSDELKSKPNVIYSGTDSITSFYPLNKNECFIGERNGKITYLSHGCSQAIDDCSTWQTNPCINSIDLYQDNVMQITYIAFASGKNIYVYEMDLIPQFTLKSTLEGHSGDIYAIKFAIINLHTRYLISSGEDGVIIIWSHDHINRHWYCRWRSKAFDFKKNLCDIKPTITSKPETITYKSGELFLILYKNGEKLNIGKFLSGEMNNYFYHLSYNNQNEFKKKYQIFKNFYEAEVELLRLICKKSGLKEYSEYAVLNLIKEQEAYILSINYHKETFFKLVQFKKFNQTIKFAIDYRDIIVNKIFDYEGVLKKIFNHDNITRSIDFVDMIKEKTISFPAGHFFAINEHKNLFNYFALFQTDVLPYRIFFNNDRNEKLINNTLDTMIQNKYLCKVFFEDELFIITNLNLANKFLVDSIENKVKIGLLSSSIINLSKHISLYSNRFIHSSSYEIILNIFKILLNKSFENFVVLNKTKGFSVVLKDFLINLSDLLYRTNELELCSMALQLYLIENNELHKIDISDYDNDLTQFIEDMKCKVQHSISKTLFFDFIAQANSIDILKLAECLAFIGQFSQSICLLFTLMLTHQENWSNELENKFHYILSISLRKLKRAKLSISLLETVVSSNTIDKNDFLYIKSKDALATSYYYQGHDHLTKALAYLQECRKWIKPKKFDSPNEYCSTSAHLANVYLILNKFDSAMSIHKKVENFLASIKYSNNRQILAWKNSFAFILYLKALKDLPIYHENYITKSIFFYNEIIYFFSKEKNLYSDLYIESILNLSICLAIQHKFHLFANQDSFTLIINSFSQYHIQVVGFLKNKHIDEKDLDQLSNIFKVFNEINVLETIINMFIYTRYVYILLYSENHPYVMILNNAKDEFFPHALNGKITYPSIVQSPLQKKYLSNKSSLFFPKKKPLSSVRDPYYPTLGDGHCFFHAVFGEIHDGQYAVNNPEKMRETWFLFLNQFHSLADTTMPKSLKNLLNPVLQFLYNDPHEFYPSSEFDTDSTINQLRNSTLEKISLAQNKNQEIITTIISNLSHSPDQFLPLIKTLLLNIFQSCSKDEHILSAINSLDHYVIKSEHNEYLCQDELFDAHYLEENFYRDVQLIGFLLNNDLEYYVSLYNKLIGSEEIKYEQALNNPQVIMKDFLESRIVYEYYLSLIQLADYYVFTEEIPILASISNMHIRVRYCEQQGHYVQLDYYPDDEIRTCFISHQTHSDGSLWLNDKIDFVEIFHEGYSAPNKSGIHYSRVNADFFKNFDHSSPIPLMRII